MRRAYLAMGLFWEYVGFGCLVVGIVSEILDQVLGLAPASWFLVGIGVLLLSIIHHLLWYVEVKEME